MGILDRMHQQQKQRQEQKSKQKTSMKWLYKNKEISEITDLPKDTFGFIYKTTHIPSGKMYIGKKSLMHSLKRKLGKKEKALWKGKGRPPIYKQVLKESDWKKYYGSHAFIIDELNNATGTDTKKYRYFPLKREIIHVAYSKKELTYLECKYQFSLSVLEDRKYLNDNILGKFFDKDFA